MNNIKFRIAAKTDIGLVRANNEDNFQASSDLETGQMHWVNNDVCSLGKLGALLVVADGMGGMNAGEVASELAIETIKDWFFPEKITSEVTKSRFSIEKYMNDAIIAADSVIKKVAKERPETKGMGTTIVIGWILDGKLYLSWCGDSRAYVYNPSAGLHQISKDHSYVQGLVDKGALSRDEAFDFPDSNIITRCLSDAATKAKPESLLRPYTLCDNDILMLCTDGLSGMIRDSKIEEIIKSCQNDMNTLADNLIQAACDAEGSDNITICLCQILQGGKVSDPSVFIESDKRLNGKRPSTVNNTVMGTNVAKSKSYRKPLFVSLICTIVLMTCIVGWLHFRENSTKEDKVQVKEPSEQSAATNTDGQTEEKSSTNEKNTETETNESFSDDSNGNNGDKSSNKADVKSGTNANKELSAEQKGSETHNKDSISGKEQLTFAGNLNSKKSADTVKRKAQKDTESYIVQDGDTYDALSKKYNISADSLMSLNKRKDSKLKAGETIIVPKIK